ncbi:MAG: peptidoglycan bridge formation glycyltransferase FemA/FemB family protein [Parcubacteria group bacterium]|jgi:lipid II:glycine glycyltransferase (peptidoglycan interpeptide bridge formation enzyme)
MDRENSKNIDFLQSDEWRKFQEAVERKTFHVEHEGSWVNIIEHKLPVVGRYFYIPRGVISELENLIVDLAKKENAGWIRFDVENEESLNSIKKNTNYEIRKAPHDMQPREIFEIDIAKPEEQLLAEMKSKTRYNINLAQKKGVKITVGAKHIDKFIDLVSLTAKRKGIKFHLNNYYRKMIETIPENILKLYYAEYNNKIIAANLIVFYDETATYLHGATDDEYRNVMAPYLLQWQAIKDAKKRGFKKYDFGGVKTAGDTNWSGITKFKLGFSQTAKPIEFLGSYDIIVNSLVYWFYRILQKFKSFVK